MCGRGRLFPDTEQPPQNAPHAAGRTPHHDLHALTSCHASTPRRRRSAETPPETSGTPPETRRRSGCPVPAPARRSPETSFRRHIVAQYIPPLLQYMKERTRRAWRAARRCFLSFRASANTGVGIRLPKKRKTDCRCAPLQDAVPYRRFTVPSRRAGPACPAEKCVPGGGTHGSRPTGAYPPQKKTTRRPARGAARFPSMCRTDGGGLYSPLLQAGTALSTLIWKRRCTTHRHWSELRTRPCSPRPRSWCQRPQPCSWPG